MLASWVEEVQSRPQTIVFTLSFNQQQKNNTKENPFPARPSSLPLLFPYPKNHPLAVESKNPFSKPIVSINSFTEPTHLFSSLTKKTSPCKPPHNNLTETLTNRPSDLHHPPSIPTNSHSKKNHYRCYHRPAQPKQ